MTAPDTVHVNKEAASRSGEQIDFSFGKNWLAYGAGLEERHIAEAQRSFTESTGLDSLAGCTFLDAGCGSGLSSLVALRLNADKVVSFDIDPSSVVCTEQLRSRFAPDSSRWEVPMHSLLHRDLPLKIAPASMVCCLGGGASYGEHVGSYRSCCSMRERRRHASSGDLQWHQAFRHMAQD